MEFSVEASMNAIHDKKQRHCMFSIGQDLLQMWHVDLVIPAESNCIPGSVTREKQKKSEKT